MIATRPECWQRGWEVIDLYQRLIIHLVSVGAEWRLAGTGNSLLRATVYAICIMQIQLMVDILKGKVGFSGNGIGRPAADICQDAVRVTAIFFSKKVD